MASSKLLENLDIDEKIRLFEGKGSWHTFDSNGKINSICMSDGPHGLRKQEKIETTNINVFNYATCFPTASAIASSWNEKALYKMGKSIGLEAHEQNVNLVLGCGMNIKRSPLCGRNFEYFSEDPFLTGKLASSYVNGMQDCGIGACVKHFACNNQETRRQTSSSIIDERTLHEIYLRAFEIVVKNANPVAIMASYNKINGVYSCQNKMLLTEILRKKWGYKGFVVSDWGACINAPEALKAGLDLVMPDSNGFYQKQLKNAYENGEISLEEIETANKRIVSAVNQLIENHVDVQNDYESQHEIALKLAEESLVLLRNNGILPIKSDKVVVIGDLAVNMNIQGEGSSHVNSKSYPNVIDSLKLLGKDVYYENDIKKAANQIELAAYKNIPVLFFCGIHKESEGYDRKSLSLPKEQIKVLKQILKITDNVIVVNCSGSPVDLSFVEKAKGLIQMYLSGEAGGEALANVITGKVNPSGHLAETFPLNLSDIPCFKYFAPEENSVTYKENVFVGYRHYETNKIPVAYEFGKGLSYTKFDYDNLKVKLPKVSFTITNVGSYDGAEVPQVYIKNPQLTDVRPVKQIRPLKELAGFDKIFLKSGESKTVEITLDDKAFCIYDVKQSDFVKVGGKYSVEIGSSIKDIRLSEEVDIQGPDIEELIEKDTIKKFFNYANYEEKHKRGEYNYEDCLNDLSKASFIVRLIKFFACMSIRFKNRGKNKNECVVQMSLSFIKESPIVSMISLSGGKVSENFVNMIVNLANRRFFKSIFSKFSRINLIKQINVAKEKINNIKKKTKK